jgi:glycosyltransferase involved in cell wall biosynthesis
MKNKKVLLDLERLRYPNSGIANVFRNLAKGLSEIEDFKNVKVFLYGPKNTLISLETTFSIVARKALHKLVSFFTLKFTVLHTSHQLSSYFHYKYTKQKKIVTLHDLNFLHEEISKKKQNKELGKVKKNIENANVIVCISEFTKQDLLANKHLFNYTTNPEIIVIHNGMQFPYLKFYGLGEFEFLADKKYILNIGVLFPKKNQLSLIKMLPSIDVDLVLVVSGENDSYKAELDSEIKRLHVGHRVHIVKNISDEEKWALIQNCESMCHPSLAEGFGIPPIEAMYFGKPVFLSNLTSLPEIGGKVAYYFTSFETEEMVSVYKKGMSEYNSDKKLTSEQLTNWAKKYDYLEMAKNYMELYKRV